MTEQLDDYERFKWDVLADLVWEDYQGIWEPLWWLRGGGRISGQSEAERHVYAERLLRELYSAGLIYFFLVNAEAGGINTSAVDPACVLAPTDVDDAIGADWWRHDGPLPDDDAKMIWIGPTPAGEAAAKDAPSQVITYWKSKAYWPPGWRPT